MLVLVSGRIQTIDPEIPYAEWMVLQDEYIVAVGLGESPTVRYDKMVDYGDYTIVPGFNDAHNHLLAYGLKLGQVNLRGVTSIPEIAARIQSQGNTPIVRAYGYNQVLLGEGRHPKIEELDRMVSDQPLIIAHTSGHMLVVNSRALEMAGIDATTQNPSGGVIDRDIHGDPTGLFLENAQDLINAALPVPTLDDLVAAIGRASTLYASWGLTSTQEAGVGWHATNEITAWQEAFHRGILGTRALLMPDVGSISWEEGEPFLYQGMRSGFGDIHLRLGPVKIFSDGSMIGRTAAMREPYEESDRSGMLIWEPDQLRSMIVRLNREGWRVAVHAIGDRAISTVLDSYEAAAREGDIRKMRHRIEHAGVLEDGLLDRCRTLGVLPVTQQHFIGELGDTFYHNIGDRVKHSYRQKSILNAGIVLAGSSDCFVVDGRPLLGIHDAVNQLTASGKAYAPAEALTVAEALEAYTYGSAYVAQEEHYKGRLRRGMLADFVVLKDNPMEVDAMSIRDIKVVATYCGGRNTYNG